VRRLRYLASGVKAALDLLLRLAFFAAAPFLLVFAAELFPITGALIQVAIALVAFFAGEGLRRLSVRSRLVAMALSGQLEFDAYYRAHPPRPFLYYVFYPLLFPYWLVQPEARREFLLFKGYTLASFALLVLSLVAQYLRYFQPDLDVRDFLPIASGTLLAEAVVVLMFLMPLVTSVVHFHLARAPGRLAALLAVAFVSVSFAVVRVERRRDPIVSFATRIRVGLRTRASPVAAQRAQASALRAAWKALPKEKQDVDSDGKIEGEVLDAAHDGLATFYKNDEAHAFDVWYSRSAKSAVMVVYFEARREHAPIWLAMTGMGALTHDMKQLPRGAFLAMKRATE
jgi:hypothetical protein